MNPQKMLFMNIGMTAADTIPNDLSTAASGPESWLTELFTELPFSKGFSQSGMSRA
jgi:hypothetical protein